MSAAKRVTLALWMAFWTVAILWLAIMLGPGVM